MDGRGSRADFLAYSVEEVAKIFPGVGNALDRVKTKLLASKVGTVLLTFSPAVFHIQLLARGASEWVLRKRQTHSLARRAGIAKCFAMIFVHQPS